MNLLQFVSNNKNLSHLKKEWDHINGPMRNFFPHSHKKVKWTCSTVKHHKWSAVIISRAYNLCGCPICNNKIVCPLDYCNSAFILHPELRKEWDNEKNGDMKNYLGNSNKRVSWICAVDNHHTWETSIGHRSGKKNKTNCPICSNKKICTKDYCNSLYVLCPELREEWDNEKNGDMKNYVKYSDKKAWWICSMDNHHKWETKIYERTKNGTGCPICNNRIICPVDQCNSLYFTNSELRKEWDNKENGSMKKYFPGCQKKVKWICKKDNHHTWNAAINSRTNKHHKSQCPICSNQRICQVDFCNSLFYSCPELRNEWDEGKNGSMKNYTPGTHKKVHWICQINSDHKWKASIANRTKKENPRGCPHCQFKSEQKSREILQDMLGITIPKCKPSFMDGLELDGYNKEYQFAFEYHGEQHYHYIPHFHRNGKSDLVKQKKRDEKMRNLCEENGIVLIEIPYHYNHNNPKELKKFIKKELAYYHIY